VRQTRFHTHSVHSMIIPIALWVFSLVSDGVFLLGGDEIWRDIALSTMVGGLVGALAASVPGYLDRSLTNSAPIGRWHMATINLTVIMLATVNVAVRVNGESGQPLPIVLSVLALGLLGMSGWLGGDLLSLPAAQGRGPGIAFEPRIRKKEPKVA
jgi:uncharacterized membrane protein